MPTGHHREKAKTKLISKYRATLLLISVLHATLAPSSAGAEEQSQTGPYLGLGLGIASELFDDSGGIDYDPGLGLSLDVGYRFHPNIAVEGSCMYMKGIHSHDTDPYTDGDILTFSGNLKGYFTTQRLQPFLLFGVGVTRVRFDQGPATGKDTGASVQIGGGVDYYLVPGASISIKAAYVEATGKIGEWDHAIIGLGAQYRF